MTKCLIFLIAFIIGCQEHAALKLTARIPLRTDLPSERILYLEKDSIGNFTIEGEVGDSFSVQVTISEGIKVPDDSYIYLFENPIGNSHLELKLGDGKLLLHDNDQIKFLFKELDSQRVDTSMERRPDLKKLTRPKVVVDQ